MRVRPLSPRGALFCDSRVPEEDRDELRLATTTVTRALADMLTPLTNPGTLQPGKAGRSGPTATPADTRNVLVVLLLIVLLTSKLLSSR